jgi:uncharacterized protein (TIGR00251 family)
MGTPSWNLPYLGPGVAGFKRKGGMVHNAKSFRKDFAKRIPEFSWRSAPPPGLDLRLRAWQSPRMALPDLSYLVRPGVEIAVRVSPRAARDSVELEEGRLAIRVTAAPVKGKANAAVLKLLARALGVPKSRLTLIRGQTGRDKLFRLD